MDNMLIVLSVGNLQVIVKFINKSRIVSDCWVDDPILGRVSQEIAILTRIQHHNIVKVMGWSSTVLKVTNFYLKLLKGYVSFVSRCWRCLKMGTTSKW